MYKNFPNLDNFQRVAFKRQAKAILRSMDAKGGMTSYVAAVYALQSRGVK